MYVNFKFTGQFDQTLNFEIVGTKRRYQMYCRGTCAFPTISREPRLINQANSPTFIILFIIHRIILIFFCYMY